MPLASDPHDPSRSAHPLGRLLRAAILLCAVAAGLFLLFAAGSLLNDQAPQFFRNPAEEPPVEHGEPPFSTPAPLRRRAARALPQAQPATPALEAPPARPAPQMSAMASRIQAIAASRPTSRAFLPNATDVPPSPRSAPVGMPRAAAPALQAAPDQRSCFLHVDPIPGVKVSTRYLYYPVRGKTPQELSDQIRRFGPFNKWLGRNSIGKADCEIRSPYQFARSSSGQCRLTLFIVNVAATITLPRWDGRGPSEVRARWETAMRNVRAHEESHRAIAIHSANAIYRALAEFQPMSCDDFENSLKAMLEGYYAETERNQSRFDKAAYQNPDCQPQL